MWYDGTTHNYIPQSIHTVTQRDAVNMHLSLCKLDDLCLFYPRLGVCLVAKKPLRSKSSKLFNLVVLTMNVGGIILAYKVTLA